jgi:hypothetical protein
MYQIGSNHDGWPTEIRGKGDDMDEWPKDLKVHQFPSGKSFLGSGALKAARTRDLACD